MTQPGANPHFPTDDGTPSGGHQGPLASDNMPGPAPANPFTNNLPGANNNPDDGSWWDNLAAPWLRQHLGGEAVPPTTPAAPPSPIDTTQNNETPDAIANAARGNGPLVDRALGGVNPDSAPPADISDNNTIDTNAGRMHLLIQQSIGNHDAQTRGSGIISAQGNMIGVLRDDANTLANNLANITIDGDSPGLDQARVFINRTTAAMQEAAADLDRVHTVNEQFQRTFEAYWARIPDADAHYNQLRDEFAAAQANGPGGFSPFGITRPMDQIVADIRANTDLRNSIVADFNNPQPGIQQQAKTEPSTLAAGSSGDPGWHLTSPTPPQAPAWEQSPSSGPVGGAQQSPMAPILAPVGPTSSSQVPTSLDTSPSSNTSADDDNRVAEILGQATPLGAMQTNPQQTGQQTGTPGMNVLPPVYNPAAQQSTAAGAQPIPDPLFNNLLDKIRGTKNNGDPTSADPLGVSSTAPTFTSQSPSGTTAAPLVQPPSWTNASTSGTDPAAGAPRSAGISPTTSGAPAKATPAAMPMMPMMPPGAGAGGGKADKADRPKIANQDPDDLYGDNIKHTQPIVNPAARARET